MLFGRYCCYCCYVAAVVAVVAVVAAADALPVVIALLNLPLWLLVQLLFAVLSLLQMLKTVADIRRNSDVHKIQSSDQLHLLYLLLKANLVVPRVELKRA